MFNLNDVGLIMRQNYILYDYCDRWKLCMMNTGHPKKCTDVHRNLYSLDDNPFYSTVINTNNDP